MITTKRQLGMILETLRAGDRLGIVTFSDNATAIFRSVPLYIALTRGVTGCARTPVHRIFRKGEDMAEG